MFDFTLLNTIVIPSKLILTILKLLKYVVYTSCTLWILRTIGLADCPWKCNCLVEKFCILLVSMTSVFSIIVHYCESTFTNVVWIDNIKVGASVCHIYNISFRNYLVSCEHPYNGQGYRKFLNELFPFIIC